MRLTRRMRPVSGVLALVVRAGVKASERMAVEGTIAAAPSQSEIL
jgi:hypothetical protein